MFEFNNSFLMFDQLIILTTFKCANNIDKEIYDQLYKCFKIVFIFKDVFFNRIIFTFESKFCC